MQALGFFKHYWPSLLAGVMMGTTFIPFPPWALAFCFVPLWWQTMQKSTSLKSAFWAGWCTQFVLSLIGFHWISYVSYEFGEMPMAAAGLVLLLFAATVHVYYAVASALGWYLHHRQGLSKTHAVLSMAIFVALAEWWWPSLFPWNLGYPLLWIKSPLAQWADVVGFWGLSCIFHLINAGLTIVILGESKSAKKYLTLGLGLTVLIAMAVTGAAHRNGLPKPDKELKALIIQANISNNEKRDGEKGDGDMSNVLNQFFSQSRAGLEKFPDSDLIIWPETAFPDFLDPWHKMRAYTREFYAFVSSIKKPILAGAYSSDPLQGYPGFNPRQRIRTYNTMFVVSENGDVLGNYHKTDLLAYGEYTPGSDLFPFLKKISPAGEGFSKGPGPSLIDFQGLNIGAQICYEGLYPSFSAQLAKLGAKVLINLTNDSWFGPRSEPFQHMIMTLARAIETRLPLLRSTNTGVSTAISAAGDILLTSPVGEAWAGQAPLPYFSNPSLTVYSSFGDYYPWTLLAVWLGSIFWLRKRKTL